MAKSGSKRVQNRKQKKSHGIPDEIPHILIVTSIFSLLLFFQPNFQIFARSFWPGSPIYALTPRTIEMAKSGSKQIQNRKKKRCHGIPDEIPHTLIVSSIFFIFGDFRSFFRSSLFKSSCPAASQRTRACASVLAITRAQRLKLRNFFFTGCGITMRNFYVAGIFG